MKTLDLSKCKKKNSRVLSGRDVGERYRKEFKLDELDKNPEKVNLIIPNDLYSINISFFLGLFGPSVRCLREEGFREKYIFACDDILKININDGIKRALKESNVLKGE